MAYQHIYVIPDQGAMKGGDLYDMHGNLVYFADVTALVDKTQTGVDKQIQRVGHTRSRFMRDPAPSTVVPTTVNVSVGLRQSKGATPGVVVTLASGSEKREFSWTGTMSALVAWLKTTAKVQIDLYGPTGTPYDPIAAVTAG